MELKKITKKYDFSSFLFVGIIIYSYLCTVNKKSMLNPKILEVMGLDIYFGRANKSTYNDAVRHNKELSEKIDALYEKNTPESIKEAVNLRGEFEPIWEELLYFRKVNLLIPFFGYKENMSDMIIPKEKVEQLVDSCKKVLNGDGDAEDLLPTEGGFFFGRTEYDDLYTQRVMFVLKSFNDLLETFDFDKYYLIMHCWW